jgi:hypothetical protein
MVMFVDGIWKRSLLILGGVPQVTVVVATVALGGVLTRLIHTHKLIFVVCVIIGHNKAFVFQDVIVWALVSTPLCMGASMGRTHGTDGILIVVLVRCTGVLVLCAVDQGAVLVPRAVAWRVRGIRVKAERVRTTSTVVVMSPCCITCVDCLRSVRTLTLAPTHIS